MKHFIGFVAVIFIALSIAFLNKYESKKSNDTKPTLRVFGYSSFTGKWGAGPVLKEIFEKNCHCRVEFMEGSDSGVLLQRLKIEGESLGVDLVVGLDQFDLPKAKNQNKWRELEFNNLDVVDSVKPALKVGAFVPYDWGVLTFVTRKGELSVPPQSLDDLMMPELSRKISVEDPRTSSPGFQFLYWVIKSKGEEVGFEFIKNMMGQVHSYSPSWSSAYGLFTKKQTSLAFSYTTSPLYHLIEEKNEGFQALNFKIPHPVQYEFMGIPEFCKNCELAEQFINLILSSDGQKVLMEKNYMYPVIKGIIDGTQFQTQDDYQLMTFEIPEANYIEDLLKKWTEIRRLERN